MIPPGIYTIMSSETLNMDVFVGNRYLYWGVASIEIVNRILHGVDVFWIHSGGRILGEIWPAKGIN